MKNEIYHPINMIGCECSINSISYDATELIVILDRCEVMDGLTSQPLYEVENSSYLNELMASGMNVLYGSSLNVKHYTINTTEHIVDILTSETYVIE